MKKLTTLSIFLLMLFAQVGCGSPGGTEGDANDPETSSDEEQMEDETGEVE